MKIKPEHYEVMRAAIAPLDTTERREQYRAAGLSDKRYRWDLSYASGLTRFCCDVLYSYVDDTHIDTALRRIVPPLNTSAPLAALRHHVTGAIERGEAEPIAEVPAPHVTDEE